jgi:hypothetical protein
VQLLAMKFPTDDNSRKNLLFIGYATLKPAFQDNDHPGHLTDSLSSFQQCSSLQRMPLEHPFPTMI